MHSNLFVKMTLISLLLVLISILLHIYTINTATIFLQWSLAATVIMCFVTYIFINYQHQTKTEKKRKFRESTYPSYPSGWYSLCWSHEVKKGEIIEKSALGNHYVIFRGEKNGEIAIMDAFCPHLGANLAGGKVCNDQLECPFHLWKFDQSGTCQNIPYLTNNAKIPKNANTKSYPSIEYHEMICVYFDNSDVKDKYKRSIPLYNLPVQHDILDKSKYWFGGTFDDGLLNFHILDIVENVVDCAHFEPIHSKIMFPWTTVQIPLINRWFKFDISPSMYVGGRDNDNGISKHNNKYFMYSKLVIDLTCIWRRFNWKSIFVSNFTICGPAGILINRMSIPWFSSDENIVFFATALPEDKMKLRLRSHWYASNKLPRLLVWFIVGNLVSQIKCDYPTLENKIFIQTPCLVKGDGPISKTRKWWMQFYPKKKHVVKSKPEYEI